MLSSIFNSSRLACYKLLKNKYLSVQYFKHSSAATDPSIDILQPPTIDGQDKKFPVHIERIVDEIAKLTLLEVSDLNELLSKRLNIKAPSHNMTFMATQEGSSVAAKAREAEEAEPVITQTAFSIKLMKFEPTKKVALIKQIKALLPEMNLVQAKKFVEAAPGVLQKDLSKDEADAMKKSLEECGAAVEIE